MWASGRDRLAMPETFEEVFVRELSRDLEATVRSNDLLRDRISIESISREPAPSIAAVVLLRDATRPECLFATRLPYDVVKALGFGQENAALAASICAANIEEEITAVGHGLPECAPGQTAWF
jgi:hypothetical protein